MIEIIVGKKGFHLKIDGLFINQDFPVDNIPQIKAIKPQYGIPYGATEWISVEAVRNFWNKHRTYILKSLQTPYISQWGQLITGIK